MKWIMRAELALGVWLVGAPWVLGYAEVSSALWGSIVTGALIFILSLWAMFGGHNHSSF